MSETRGQDLINKLRTERPEIAITVSRFEDWMEWDGDGPNPEEEGYVCYTVDVKAKAIRGGHEVEGNASLGSCYRLPKESIGEVSGYLPQMVEEAVEELDKQLAAL